MIYLYMPPKRTMKKGKGIFEDVTEFYDKKVPTKMKNVINGPIGHAVMNKGAEIALDSALNYFMGGAMKEDNDGFDKFLLLYNTAMIMKLENGLGFSPLTKDEFVQYTKIIKKHSTEYKGGDFWDGFKQGFSSVFTPGIGIIGNVLAPGAGTAAQIGLKAIGLGYDTAGKYNVGSSYHVGGNDDEGGSYRINQNPLQYGSEFNYPVKSSSRGSSYKVNGGSYRVGKGSSRGGILAEDYAGPKLGTTENSKPPKQYRAKIQDLI